MKKEYQTLLDKINAIVDPTLPLVSNLANISSILFELEDVNWAGFYLSNKEYLSRLKTKSNSLPFSTLSSALTLAITSLPPKSM